MTGFGALSRLHPRRWRLPGLGVWLIAAITYLPSITAKPGRMPTDTKLYLYLDPSRLVSDAPFSWDTRQFAGWVPHQTIAYLWPSGPWFFAFDQLGVPDWIAHRLWIGTILFLGGLGVRWAARHLGLTTLGATVAGVVYATSPYILPYVSRTSVMLLPWAAVGWLVGLTIRATTRTRWRDAAVFALVVLTVGAVNAAALALIAPAPVLWLVHAAWQRTINWRTALVTAARLGSLSLLVSLWWIAMLLVQGRHGADVLAFSETLEAVSHTSVSTETLRGLGYWLFYVRDPYAFTTSASVDYMNSVKIILIGWLLLVVCLLGLALTRWSQRRYAALLVGAGIVLAVGVHPIADPSPLMSPLKDSAVGLALRSSTRALPLSTLGFALGAGALVTAAGAVRWRARHAVAPVVAVLVVVLALGNLPAAFTGGYVDAALERDHDVPGAWTQAAASLDRGSSEFRVLQLPGSEFGAFRWGYTVDPPLPGLTDKPLVTRDLLPLGSAGAMDLLYALDNRVQAGTFEPESLARVARFLGVDTVWVANDLAFDRFRTPRPEAFADLFSQPLADLRQPQPFGTPTINVPDISMLDEQQLSDPAIGTPVAPVELVSVEQPVAIVRASATTVVLAGSGDGIVDAAAAGLLQGDEAVLYAGDLQGLRLGLDNEALPDGALLIVTDSNRDRAMQWRGSQDVLGLTERGGPDPDVTRTDTADHRLDAIASTDERDQTVAVLEGGLQVSATSYGELFAYRPEDRPAMAVDGDPTTAWRVADRANPVGESLQLSVTDGTLTLLQDQRPDSNRSISQIRIQPGGNDIDRATVIVELDERSLVAPGQPVVVPAGVPITITIEAVVDRPDATDSGFSAVGFAELGPVAIEFTRLPQRPLDDIDATRPVAIVMTRDRVRATNRWRADPDNSLRREFSLPVARSFDGTITLRLAQRAGDAQIDALAGWSGLPVANRRLTGVPAARGTSAVDADPTTAYTTPFGQAVGSGVTIPIQVGPVADAWAAQRTIGLTQVDDLQHSPITQITLTSDRLPQPLILDVPAPDAGGSSQLALTEQQAANLAVSSSVTVTITGVQSVTTTDRRYAEQVQLPAAIAEIGLPVQPANVAPVVECHTGLVSIDGVPLGVTFGAGTAALLMAGGAADVVPCDGPLELGAGVHRITSAAGITTGIDVDRITLRSAVTADASIAPGIQDAGIQNAGLQNAVVDVRRTRTLRQVTVGPCPAGCWLILGEGHNDAWTAQGPDGDLGAPVPISGGFNGWWLAPDDGVRTVEMRWSPQGRLNLALMVALGAVLICVVIAVTDRRVLRATVGFEPPQFDIDPSPVRPVSLISAAAVLVAGSALVIQPSWGLIALVPAAALIVVRRPRLLALAAAAAAAVLGLVSARRQYNLRFFADAAWPVRFDDLHAAGLFVVVLLVASSLSSDEHGLEHSLEHRLEHSPEQRPPVGPVVDSGPISRLDSVD